MSLLRLTSFLGLVLVCSCQKSMETRLSPAAPVSISSNDMSFTSGSQIADWETGDANQWYGLCLAHPSQYSTVTWPVRQGRFAGKFVVHPGDYNNGGERCEVAMWGSRSVPFNSYTQEIPGNDYYYGWSTQFPWDWQTPPGYCIFYQFQQRADNLHPVIAFNVLGESIQVNFSSGVIAGNVSNYTSAFSFMPTHNQLANPVIVNSLSRGKWHDFIVHVRFAPDNTGVFEVWHRLEGSADFTEVLNYQHVPTEQWTTDPSDFLKEGVYSRYRVNNVAGDIPNIYVKMGLYRPVVAGNIIVNTIYGDNWSRGTSYSEIRSTFK